VTDQAGSCLPEYAEKTSSLGIYTFSYSAPAENGSDLVLLDRVVSSYMLQSNARWLMLQDFESDQPVAVHRGEFPNKLCACQRLLIKGASIVPLLHFTGRKHGGYKNLIACARGWICPVCGRKISERRRAHLESVLRPVSDQLVMLTLTVSHNRSDSFQSVLDLVKLAYNKLLVSDRAALAQNDQWGIIGKLRALEAMYGINGAHVHMHTLLMLNRKWSEVDLASMENQIKQRWIDVVESLGGYASFEHGATLSHEMALTYPAKLEQQVQIGRSGSGGWTIFHEMAKSAVKQSRGQSGVTMLELLAGSALDGIDKGDLKLSKTRCGELWLEYAGAFHAEKHLVPSGELRGIVGKLADLTDAQLEQEEIDRAVIMGALDREGWQQVLAHDIRGELRSVLGSGDPDALIDYLASFGIKLMRQGE
jgi:hypothetical protein